MEEKYEIAKNLLQYGVDIELVAKGTGLALKEVEAINAGESS